MSRSRIISLIMILTLLLSMAACSDEPEQTTARQGSTRPGNATTGPKAAEPTESKSEIQPDLVAKAVIGQLASSAFDGRLAGTPGNEQAGQYLARFFREQGFLSVIGKEFFQEYAHSAYHPDVQQTRMIVTHADGSKTELEAGRDFITSPSYRDMSLFAELDFRAAVPGSPGIIPVIADLEADMHAYDSPVVIRAGDMFNLTPRDFSGVGPFVIQISSLMKDTWIRNGVTQAQVTTKSYQPDKLMRNVVAMLKSDGSHRSVIVLTAHYDHYGSQGRLFFPGAFDNASGVGALLSTAVKIKEQLGTDAPPMDIVFAAVNSGIYQYGIKTFPGSKALENALSKRYDDVFLINFDRVGNAAAGPLAMGALNRYSELLANRLKATFDRHDVSYRDEPYGRSDHEWFIKNGAAAATVGQDLPDSRTPILTDVPEKLDYAAMAKVTSAVSEFVIQHGADLFDQYKDDYFNSPGWWLNALQERDRLLAGRELAYHEAMHYVFDRALVTATGYRPLTSQADIARFHPTMKVEPELNGFTFDHLEVHTTHRPSALFLSDGLYRLNDQRDRVTTQQENSTSGGDPDLFANMPGALFRQPVNPWDITSLILEYQKGDRYLAIDIHVATIEMRTGFEAVQPDGMDTRYTLYRRSTDAKDAFSSIACLSGVWEIEVSSYRKMPAADSFDPARTTLVPDPDSKQMADRELIELADQLLLLQKAATLIDQLGLNEAICSFDLN